jgi:hypothetical protein
MAEAADDIARVRDATLRAVKLDLGATGASFLFFIITTSVRGLQLLVV